MTKKDIEALLLSLTYYEKGRESDYGCLNSTVWVEHLKGFMNQDVEKVVEFLKKHGVEVK